MGSCDGAAWTWRACKESESSDEVIIQDNIYIVDDHELLYFCFSARVTIC